MYRHKDLLKKRCLACYDGMHDCHYQFEDNICECGECTLVNYMLTISTESKLTEKEHVDIMTGVVDAIGKKLGTCGMSNITEDQYERIMKIWNEDKS